VSHDAIAVRMNSRARHKDRNFMALFPKILL
jgi:hypothetical protein